MTIHTTDLPGVLILEPRILRDERGFFLESYSHRVFQGLGIDRNWVQDNHSRSPKGTLRGLHFQLQQPQAKLCRVARGRVLDVAVDVRWGSPTFGQHTSVELSSENGYTLFIPRGFAHGFLVLSEEADFLYKCDDYYSGAHDQCGVRWNDPTLNIQWPMAGNLDDEPILSPKDKSAPLLNELGPHQLPAYAGD